jgi:hypothetical protein
MARDKGLLSDLQLRHWIKAGAPLAKADGNGLTFTLSAAGGEGRNRSGGADGAPAVSRRTDEAELVIYVAIDQASAPLLYSDLATLSQGPKLVQRLRMLALQGLIFESGPLAKPAREWA